MYLELPTQEQCGTRGDLHINTGEKLSKAFIPPGLSHHMLLHKDMRQYCFLQVTQAPHFYCLVKIIGIYGSLFTFNTSHKTLTI